MGSTIDIRIPYIMSDWDTTTRIGQKHKGGAAPRETTIKGGSALNAAQRQGLVVGTDKKYATGNAAKSLGSDGQHKTKVDRDPDIVKPKEVGADVADVIKKRRNEEPYKMTQKELAAKCNTTPTVIQGFETGRGQPDQKVLSTISRVLNVHLSNKNGNIGKPLRAPKENPPKKK